MFFSKLQISKLFSALLPKYQFLKYVPKKTFGGSKWYKPSASSCCNSGSAHCMNQKMLPFMGGCQDYIGGCPQSAYASTTQAEKKIKKKGINLKWTFLLGFVSFATIACLSSSFDENNCKKDK